MLKERARFLISSARKIENVCEFKIRNLSSDFFGALVVTDI